MLLATQQFIFKQVCHTMITYNGFSQYDHLNFKIDIGY